MEKEKNVFISHHSKDHEHIDKFKNLLSKKGYIIKNSSIRTKPNRLISNKVIERLLRMRINWAGTFICLIGKNTHNRTWVDWELDEAKERGKKIIGVCLYGEKDAILPEKFDEYNGILTGWNGDKIIEAIEGENPNAIVPTEIPANIVKSPKKVACNV